jgi:pimeloyl-ACP methyl ester carboxylesterase
MRSDRLVRALVLAAAVQVAAGAAAADLRQQPCVATDAAALAAWQQEARTTLGGLLRIDDQLAGNRHDATGLSPLPLQAETLSREERDQYTRWVLEIDSRPDRRIQVVLTVPAGEATRRRPAVVCIHGHGGNRDAVYNAATPYRGFATALAERGYVTLSTDVGQHTVQSPQRTLMGERLWDLIRVVDLAASREEVDPRRIGCAGLSLGGEMAMWLAAIDTRLAATVSSGFLTTMDNLREGHCPCWDFPGLQQRYDIPDIYCLISPRPLQCQNGRLERLPGGFPVELAEQAIAEIRRAYRAAGCEDAAQLAVHEDGHVFDVPSAVEFLNRALGPDGP